MTSSHPNYNTSKLSDFLGTEDWKNECLGLDELHGEPDATDNEVTLILLLRDPLR
jgi:hypothetical protein